jgi:hypothetical protein
MSTYEDIQRSFLEEDNEEVNALAEEIFKPSAKRKDPFADERPPFISGDLKDDLAKYKVWLTILDVREGENTYNKKTTEYWYIDVRVKCDHENFSQLRESDVLQDGCGTLSFAKHGKDGQELKSRTTQFSEVKTMLPYRYVTLDRSGGFDKFRTVSQEE